MRDTPTDAAADDLPRFHDFFAPALAALAPGETMQTRDIIAEVSDRLGLTPEQRNQVIPSGQRRLDNRVTWALSYLFHAEAVRKHRRGLFEITERGRKLAQVHPDGFGLDVLRHFEEFRAFQTRSKGSAGAQANGPTGPDDTSDQTPFEQISAAVEQLDADVAIELMQRLHAAPPEFLEKAVLRLLVAMGYGGSDEAAVHLGGPGDGGFDGVINQDPLGIGRIYIQAKRYKADNAIGRPDVQAFLGALHHAGAAGGVFITTSRFTPDAVAFARSITPRVILIDGPRLGRLMVTHGIGVQERQTFRVVETDEDFFETA
ncbi:restriction endonuclease [Streptomyces mirabilis]|uniref:restriction endonuclease n=1 Tax=Streptomyces mirabilis TaxID=68239 RepID=UPI00364F3E80